MIRQSVAAAFAAVLAVSGAHAQMRRPSAEVTLSADADAVRAGTSARFVLAVALPEGLHVQSHAPRDPSLIPTVLTIAPPAGVVVAEVVYPEPADFRLAGSSQVLAVYGNRFTIGVLVKVASTLPAGDIVLPAKLHYQACDASSCFPPATDAIRWTIHVVGAKTAVTPRNADLFAAVRFTAPAGAARGR